MSLQQHPLSAAFPAMPDQEFRELVEDIRKHGQRDPILIYEGMVLDGWHRYTACIEIGFEPKKFTWAGDDPVSYVESVNLHRRHLTASQRAMAVVALAEWAPANVKRRAAAAPQENGGRGAAAAPQTNADMAKAAKVSERTIKDAKAAHRAGLTEPVKQGAMTVEEAARVARGKPEPKPKKESLKSAAAPHPPAAPDADELAEAQHTITELAAENEELRDRIAVEAMEASEDEKTQAAETIRELRERVRLLEIEVEALKVSRDTYMRESSEKTAQINYWRKQAKKAGAEA